MRRIIKILAETISKIGKVIARESRLQRDKLRDRSSGLRIPHERNPKKRDNLLLSDKNGDCFATLAMTPTFLESALRRSLYVLVTWWLGISIAIPICAHSQNLRSEDEIFLSPVQTRGGIVTEFVQLPFASKGYLSSALFGSHQLDRLTLGFFLNVNRNLLFEVKDGPLVIELPDSALLLEQGDVSFPPNSYEIDHPIALCGSYAFEPFEFLLSSRLYTQTETSWRHRLIDVGSNTYYIKVENITHRRSEVSLTAAAGYSFEGFHFIAGVSGFRLAGWGDDSLQKLKTRPLLRIGLPMLGGIFFGESNMEGVGLSQSFGLDIPWLPEERQLFFTSVVKSNFSAPKYELLEFNLKFPVYTNVNLIAGYRRVWSSFDRLSKQKFDLWRSSLSTMLDGEPLSGIDHTAFKFGAVVEFGSSRTEFPLDLVGSKFFHRNIYSAKKDFYAYNPVGTLDIRNKSKRAVVCQVSLELPDRLGSYKSESMKVEPDEVKTVPVFLYLSEEKLSGISSLVQMDIAIQMDEKRHLLSTVPVTLFDVHSWDGNTYGLRYFITPNEPSIQTNAKRKYLKTLADDSLSTEPRKKIGQLSSFLSELGGTLRYIQDPTTSLYVDHVQYPTETLELQSGDCEDLVVFVASHLMAVGIQCALVDMKPSTGEVQLPAARQTNGAQTERRRLGHIMLLVNTEIEPEQVNDIGLNEFQFVSRTSATGKNTIWLPVETTALSLGFDKAFAEGVRQYYKEVVELDGMKKGVVHVYDF